MKNEIQIRGIVLKIYPVKETSEKALILTPKGILSVLSFGTQKSTKKGKLFTFLIADFHLELKKEQWNLKEISSPILLGNLSQNITKFYTASTFCEIVLKEHDAGMSFSLLEEAFWLLERENPANVRYIVIQFFLRWIQSHGELGNREYCDLCDKPLRGVLFYATEENGFVCGTCAQTLPAPSLFMLNEGIRLYLIASTCVPLSQSLKRKIDKHSERTLLSYLYQKVQNILKWKLKSWELTQPLLFIK